MTISFKISGHDSHLIFNIAERADTIYRRINKRSIDRMSLTMDLTACHANGYAIKFARLMEAEEFDFVHDVFGIMNNINRKTGVLDNCFLPRYAA